MGKSRQKQKVVVPECLYGQACTRKDCIYRHSAPASGTQTHTVCMAYVGGWCTFGQWCRNQHPTDEECAKLAAKYGESACRFGADCQTIGCLYKHPENNHPQTVSQIGAPTVWADEARTMVLKPKEPVHMPSKPSTARIPTAIARSLQLRDPTAFKVVDFMDRFVAVNRHNSGIESARVCDLYLQTSADVPHILDTVLLPATLEHVEGVWVITSPESYSCGSTALPKGILYDDVRTYLVLHQHEFQVGVDEGEVPAGAFLVFPPRGVQRIRAILLWGETEFATELAARSSRVVVCQNGEAWLHALHTNLPYFWDWFADAYCAIALRGSVLSFLDSHGILYPKSQWALATLAYTPSPLEITRYLGCVFAVEFIYYLRLRDKNAEDLCCLIIRVSAHRDAAGSVDKGSYAFFAHIVLSASSNEAKRACLNLNCVKWDQIVVDPGTRITSTLVISSVIDFRPVRASCRALGCLVSKATQIPYSFAFESASLADPALQEAVAHSLTDVRLTDMHEGATEGLRVQTLYGVDFPEVAAYFAESAQTAVDRLRQGYVCVYRGQTFLPPLSARCPGRLCVLDCEEEERFYWVGEAGLNPAEVGVIGGESGWGQVHDLREWCPNLGTELGRWTSTITENAAALALVSG